MIEKLKKQRNRMAQGTAAGIGAESRLPAVLPLVTISEDGRPVWSVNVELPPKINAEIQRYVEEDKWTAWTVMIHGTLYLYRAHLWPRERLEAEFRDIIEERLKSVDRGEFTEVTPQFWKDFRRDVKRDGKRIRELQAEGKIGNLMLPQELYDFVKERMASGECKTPTDVIVAAMPHLRRSREKENAGALRRARPTENRRKPKKKQ
jgi:Arc/MetJ-type ribon-helix-helix transcriptional regulator